MKYNIEFLVKIQLKPLKKSSWFKYYSEKKILGIVIKKEGVYDVIDDNYIGETPKNHYLKNDVVCEKPCCTLYYLDGTKKTYYFETLTDAIYFRDQFTIDKKWID